MRKKTIYGLLFIATLVFCLSVALSAKAASDEEEVLQVMTDWFKAFNTNDYDLMSSLHWHSPEISYFGPAIVMHSLPGDGSKLQKYLNLCLKTQ